MQKITNFFKYNNAFILILNSETKELEGYEPVVEETESSSSESSPDSSSSVSSVSSTRLRQKVPSHLRNHQLKVQVWKLVRHHLKVPPSLLPQNPPHLNNFTPCG